MPAPSNSLPLILPPEASPLEIHSAEFLLWNFKNVNRLGGEQRSQSCQGARVRAGSLSSLAKCPLWKDRGMLRIPVSPGVSRTQERRQLRTWYVMSAHNHTSYKLTLLSSLFGNYSQIWKKMPIPRNHTWRSWDSILWLSWIWLDWVRAHIWQNFQVVFLVDLDPFALRALSLVFHSQFLGLSSIELNFSRTGKAWEDCLMVEEANAGKGQLESW